MERFYSIAGVEISIVCDEEQMYNEELLLKNFSSKASNRGYEYTFEIVDKLKVSAGICVYTDSTKIIYYNNNSEIRYVGDVKQGIEQAYIRIEKK